MKSRNKRNKKHSFSILIGVVYLLLISIIFLKPIAQIIIHSSNEEIELSESGSEEEIEFLNILMNEDIESMYSSFALFVPFTRQKKMFFYTESNPFSFVLEINTPPPELFC